MRRVADGSQTVLIVDDDASVRAMLGYLLDDEGYTVREASEIRQFLARFTPKDAR